MSSGVIDNWDLMEKLWHRSIYDYMRCEPEESVFILTEPLLILLKIEKVWLKYFLRHLTQK